MVFLRSRWYDPETGRFVQPDDARPDLYDPRTLNRYVYVRNDPVHNFDPTGQLTLVETLVTVGVVGILLTGLITITTPHQRPSDVWKHIGGAFASLLDFDHPDAVIKPIASAYVGEGAVLLGGLEYLVGFPRGDAPQALYAFLGTGVGGGFFVDGPTGIEGGIALTYFDVGIAFDTPSPANYEGWFISLSLGGGYSAPFQGTFSSLTLSLGFTVSVSPTPTYFSDEQGNIVKADQPGAMPRFSHAYVINVGGGFGGYFSFGGSYYWRLDDDISRLYG
jgi:hypothetical protein